MRLRSLEAFLIALLVVVSVEWTYLAYLQGMIDTQLAVTLIIVEVPTELALAWLISKVLEKPDELARKTAVEKQRLEESNRRRTDIWKAIEEWVRPPQAQFQIGGQQEPLFLGERHPRLATEIDSCLSQHYPSIWARLQEFRAKYAELMAMKAGKIPEEFWEKSANETTLHYGLLLAREDSIHNQLVQVQRELIQRINTEILERHDTQLKC